MRGSCFFVLDSPRPGSLTLRDYSKVVCGYKQSLFNGNSNFSPMSGGPMPSQRARWSELCLCSVYLKTLCLALVVFLALPAILSAQGTGGRILGRVSDPTGAVLGGTKVTATNDATGVVQDAACNESGDYSFPNLP